MDTTPSPGGRNRAGQTEADPLVGALDKVANAVGDLVAESRRRDRRTLVLQAVIAVLVVALAGMALSNRKINDSNGEILRVIRDCTTEDAPGDCYETNQEKTAGYIRELIVTELDIAWCTKISPSKDEAARCVATAGEPPR
jgi:hypothetical protein